MNYFPPSFIICICFNLLPAVDAVYVVEEDGVADHPGEVVARRERGGASG
jgi:hypothetical protein